MTWVGWRRSASRTARSSCAPSLCASQVRVTILNPPLPLYTYCLFIHLSCVVEVQRSLGKKPEAELRDDVTVQMMTDVMQKQGLEMNAVTKLSEQQVLVVFRDIICGT